MKCTAVLTCEKIIIDKEGAHSIINVMLNAEIALQKVETSDALQQTPIPPDAVAPMVWWVYTVWHPSPGDVGKDFEQVYQAYWPNGDKFMESRLPLKVKEEAPIQTTFQIGGLPAGQEGQLRVVTWLDDQGHRTSEVNEAFIRIKHRAMPAATVPAIA